MPTKEILVPLIELLDQFEKENPQLEEGQLTDFLAYIQSNVAVKTNEETHQHRARLISQKIGLIYRYTKEYTKKALEGSNLQTVEEFSFLIVLMHKESLSKTELILENALPKTSGVEVIKRLLKKGMLSQIQDKNDKRSQRVAITPKGRSEIQKILPKMQQVSTILSGNLTNQEQNTLVYLLQKLDVYHKDLFLNASDKGLDELEHFH